MAQDDRMTMIEQRLRSALLVDSIDIVDESDLHVGHVGAESGGGHFRLTIVSRDFDSLSPLVRHRMVYEALGDAVGTEIHAVSIRALSPNETEIT